MKIKCSQESLKEALSVVSRVVPARQIMPVTQCVLVKAEDGKLILTCSDLTSTLCCSIPVEIEIPGSACVPAKTLLGLVDSFSGDTIDIESDKASIILRCGKSKSKLQGQDPDDFPPIKTIKGNQFEIDSGVFTKAVTRVAFSASKDEARRVLFGIELKVSNGILSLAASDSFRLSHETIKIDNIPDMYALLPAQQLNDFVKLFKGKIKVTVSENSASLDDGNILVILQCIVGKFPDIASFIKEDKFNTRTKVEAAKFIAACKASIVFEVSRVKLLFQPDGILASVSSTSGSSESEVETKLEGESQTIFLNGNYLNEALKNMSMVDISFTTPSNKFCLREGDYLHILMPVYGKEE